MVKYFLQVVKQQLVQINCFLEKKNNCLLQVYKFTFRLTICCKPQVKNSCQIMYDAFIVQYTFSAVFLKMFAYILLIG